MNSKHFLNISADLVELCVPSNICMSFSPLNASNNLLECEESIATSLLPDKNIADLYFPSGSYFIWSIIDSLLIDYDVFFLKSDPTQQKTHENKQENKHEGIHFTCFSATDVHIYFIDENAESAIIILISDSSTEAAPILLPHPTTRYPSPSKNLAARLACLDSLIPNVINSSLPFPHPSKSKQASATSSGISFTTFIPSSLHELLPCRYKIQYLHYFRGEYIVISNGI